MTSAAPAHGAAPPMAYTPDPAAGSETQTVDDAVMDRPARPKLRDQIAENLLLSLLGGLMLALLTFFGTVVVALFIFNLTSINDRLESIEGRIDRLDAKVDAGFAAQGAKMAELDARLTAQNVELDRKLTAQNVELDRKLTALIAELDRKLTALIAHLNATEAVEAALEHRSLIPNDSAPEPEGEASG